MMRYRITQYTKDQAKKIGVTVKPSMTKGKKIDVFNNDVKIATVGALGYNDFPTYMQLEKQGKVPKGTADQRRKLYKMRHNRNRLVANSNGYYADKLLW